MDPKASLSMPKAAEKSPIPAKRAEMSSMDPAKAGYIHTHMAMRPPTPADQTRKLIRYVRSSFLTIVIG